MRRLSSLHVYTRLGVLLLAEATLATAERPERSYHTTTKTKVSNVGKSFASHVTVRAETRPLLLITHAGVRQHSAPLRLEQRPFRGYK